VDPQLPPVPSCSSLTTWGFAYGNLEPLCWKGMWPCDFHSRLLSDELQFVAYVLKLFVVCACQLDSRLSYHRQDTPLDVALSSFRVLNTFSLILSLTPIFLEDFGFPEDLDSGHLK